MLKTNPLIKKGTVTKLSEKYDEWILGKFIEETQLNTKNSKNFEIKWSKRKKGYIHQPKEKKTRDNACHSMALCVYGKFQFEFQKDSKEFEKHMLHKEGDYVFWKPNIPHKVKILEDSLIITIRWYNQET